MIVASEAIEDLQRRRNKKGATATIHDDTAAGGLAALGFGLRLVLKGLRRRQTVYEKKISAG